MNKFSAELLRDAFRAQGIRESAVPLRAALGITAPSFAPSRHGNSLFLSLRARAHRRLAIGFGRTSECKYGFPALGLISYLGFQLT